MTTPLYDALCQYSGRDPLRLHMPGHKGRVSGPLAGFARLDATELPPIGNLYTDEGPVQAAEALFARAGGARDALFFSCGATQGIQTMLAAAAGMGGTLILDRGCHQSVYHAIALLDIEPVFLFPPLLPDRGLPAPVTPALLDRTLRAHPDARAVCLTSPSYYGVITDLKPLAELCRTRGVYLLVDQAHGAHFPFVGLPTAIQEGADLCVVSAHKTLPALGSASVLYVGENAPWDQARLKALSAIFSTTSPSWPILASIDLARAHLEQSGQYRAAAQMTAQLRRRIVAETPFHVLSDGPGLRLDPCRLVIDTAAAGLCAKEADRLLQAQGVYVEMSDDRYLVSILTCCDTEADMNRFMTALTALPTGQDAPPAPVSPPAPVPRTPLRQALFGPSERIALSEAAGRTAAQILAPYPPGVPLVIPGEEITEKHIAYLQKKRYNISEIISVTA